jgi:scyllo-inositol 2-dehydrogenase (NADP+)
MASNPVKVGILGLGRSGWGIHCGMIRTIPEMFEVAAVYDVNEPRMQQVAADMGCRAAANEADLFNDPELELIIVASYNHLHAPHACEALAAGKHVLCEKPFGLTVADADRMIELAESKGRLIAPFQQRRYEEDFCKVKEIVDSGILGDVIHIRTSWHGFKRRWDWQTSRTYAGGALNNNGPHPLDHTVALFGGDDPCVWAQASRNLCSGDAEDHLKVILSGEGHPTVELELTDVWAYAQERWVVAGTRGGLHGSPKKLEWKWVDFESMPERPLCMESTPDRSYNSEKLEWQTDSWTPEGEGVAGGAGAAPPPGAVLLFYRGLHAALRDGKPLHITPQSVRVRVAVMEKIRAAAGIPAMA